MWQVVEFECGLLPVLHREGWTFLCEVVREAVDSSFGELLSTCLAGMFVSVAAIVQLGSSLKVLEDQCWSKLESRLENKSSHTREGQRGKRRGKREMN